MNRFFRILAALLLPLLFGCVAPVRENPSSQEELRKTRAKVQDIARRLNIPEDQVGRASTPELLVDISSALLDSGTYPGQCLDETELKKVETYFYNQPRILKKIKEQNSYIREMKGRKVILLPREKE